MEANVGPLVLGISGGTEQHKWDYYSEETSSLRDRQRIEDIRFLYDVNKLTEDSKENQ
jgi:hypothetical protein